MKIGRNYFLLKLQRETKTTRQTARRKEETNHLDRLYQPEHVERDMDTVRG